MTVRGRSPDCCWYPSPTKYVESWLWSSPTRISSMRETKSRGIRSSTCARVDAALYATITIPIRFMGAKGTERSRAGRRPRLADAAVGLVRDGGGILVDVVDAGLALVLGRVLDARRRSAPFDRLHLVVHRAVRAVHG